MIGNGFGPILNPMRLGIQGHVFPIFFFYRENFDQRTLIIYLYVYVGILISIKVEIELVWSRSVKEQEFHFNEIPD